MGSDVEEGANLYWTMSWFCIEKWVDFALQNKDHVAGAALAGILVSKQMMNLC